MGLIQGFKGMILPTGVSLSASTASIGSGVEYQLEAYITPELASNNKIHWSASNNNVTVDENGLVTGVTDGTSVVTATTDYGGYTASCTFTIFTIPVTGVSLDTNKLTLTPGKTYQLTATITPNNATNKKVTWRSTDTSVAVVDNNGLVTCVANGDAEIIVTTADGNYTDSCEIITDWAPTENTWVYLPLNGTLDRYGTKEGTVSAGSDIGWTDITSIAKGINFKGNTNSYVQINSVPEMNTDFTINFWIYLNGLSDAIMVERGTADSTNRDLHYVVRNSGHTADLGFYANDCPGTTALNTGTWYNLMATYNHTTREQKVYINGVINNTRTGSGDPAFGTGPLYIGCKKSYSSSNPVNGTMCRFILEDKIWTAEEGLEYYNLTKGIIFKDDINSYDELEYIQSDGNQYIDTLYKHNANTKVDMKFNYQSMSTQRNAIYGARTAYNNADAFDFNIQYSTYMNYNIGGASNDNFASSSTDTDYEISVSKTKYIVNGTEYNVSSNSLTSCPYNDWIFWDNQQNSGVDNKIKMKLYYCKIYDNLELVRDFIPAQRKSDGVIGLYDKVEDKFYANSGSGTFTAGPKVGVILSSNSISFTEAGQTKQLTVTANPSSIGNQGYRRKSSDTSIATVSSNGLVTCVTPGNCTIICTAIATGHTDTCSVATAQEYIYNFDDGTWTNDKLTQEGWVDGGYGLSASSGGLVFTNTSTDKGGSRTKTFTVNNNWTTLTFYFKGVKSASWGGAMGNLGTVSGSTYTNLVSIQSNYNDSKNGLKLNNSWVHSVGYNASVEGTFTYNRTTGARTSTVNGNTTTGTTSLNFTENLYMTVELSKGYYSTPSYIYKIKAIFE